jgi:small subunit ribosomal protein S2
MSVNIKEISKDELVKKMFDLGAHFGYARESRHASTKPFLFGLKNKTVIIDLEKTADSLATACEFAKSIGMAKKNIILVGTKKEAATVIQNIAVEYDLPYVNERWIGGTMTNFKQIRSRIDRLIDLKDQEAKGELSKYTKKERGVIAKEVSDLERYFASLITLTKLPGAIFVVDSKKESIAVAGAIKLSIPVIALANSDCDIRGISHPIVANDAQLKVIDFFAREIAEAHKEGLRESDKKAAEATAQATETAKVVA